MMRLIARYIVTTLACLWVGFAIAQTPLPVSPANDIKAKNIGEVILVKGVVTTRSDSRPLTTLSKGSKVFLKDTITTAEKSFVVIRFTDGSKTTLRPDSELVINEYSAKVGQERKTVQLLKGGLRSVTGAIGKAKPKSVKYQARNLTIGIRGTEFVLILCESGVCKVDGEKAGSTLSGDSEKELTGDIFVNNKQTGEKQKITRQDFRESLDGLYVSVQDGAIRLESEDWFIDMPVGESCLAGSGGGIECFKPGIGIEDLDQYLNGNIEALVVINLFEGSDSLDKKTICEIF